MVALEKERLLWEIPSKPIAEHSGAHSSSQATWEIKIRSISSSSTWAKEVHKISPQRKKAGKGDTHLSFQQ
jgi:hypothetical protein